MIEKDKTTKTPEKTSEVKPSVQHQLLNLSDNSNEKAIKELTKRLEAIERTLKYRNYNRYNQRQTFTQKNTNQKQEASKQEEPKSAKAPQKNTTTANSNYKPPLNQ